MKKLLQKGERPFFITLGMVLCVYSAWRGLTTLFEASQHSYQESHFWLEIALCVVVFSYSVVAIIFMLRSAHQSRRIRL